MNQKIRDLGLLVIVAGVGYFLWKSLASPAAASTATATSNTSPTAASTSNLLAPITGLFGIGQAGQPTMPSSLPTSLDDLDSSINLNNPVASSPSLDNSGGYQDDIGTYSDDDEG